MQFLELFVLKGEIQHFKLVEKIHRKSSILAEPASLPKAFVNEKNVRKWTDMPCILQEPDNTASLYLCHGDA